MFKITIETHEPVTQSLATSILTQRSKASEKKAVVVEDIVNRLAEVFRAALQDTVADKRDAS